jgi:hypothetical protein
VLNLGQAAIIAIGLTLIMLLAASGMRDGTMTVGKFVVVNTYLIQLYQPLNFLGVVYMTIKQGLVDMEQMFALLRVAREIADKPDAKALTAHLSEGSAGEVVFERALNGKAAALFANVHGTRLSSLILAGKNGAELADKGASAMTDFALDWVSDMFRSSVKKSIVRTQAFSWNKQPWTLGALSSGNPGALEAREALAEPVNGVLWFAGEAVNQTYWATVGGAWQDGERAADAVIAHLK